MTTTNTKLSIADLENMRETLVDFGTPVRRLVLYEDPFEAVEVRVRLHVPHKLIVVPQLQRPLCNLH